MISQVYLSLILSPPESEAYCSLVWFPFSILLLLFFTIIFIIFRVGSDQSPLKVSKLNEILSKKEKHASNNRRFTELGVGIYDVRHRKWVLLGQATENLWGFIGLV